MEGYFGEIDKFRDWEKYVRQKLDEGFHVCVSSSIASLLEGAMGMKLTGRHISKELFKNCNDIARTGFWT